MSFKRELVLSDEQGEWIVKQSLKHDRSVGELIRQMVKHFQKLGHVPIDNGPPILTSGNPNWGRLPPEKQRKRRRS